MAGSLESVHCKIFRAVEHYNALLAAGKEYFEGKVGIVMVDVNPQASSIGVSVVVGREVPPQIPLIVGDCLQNLRSALDYLVWELCLVSNVEPTDKHAFPICRTKESFRDIKGQRLAGLPEDVIKEVEDFQPYQAGQDWAKTSLWVLNELSNINKHRRILLTQLDCDFAHTDRITGAMRRRDRRSEETTPAKDELVAFMAFKDGVAKDAEVTHVLNTIAEEIGEAIIPQFARFFDRAS
jgi:hypothetical protein